VQQRRQLTGDTHRAGVLMLAGTDANGPFVLPGFSLHAELAFMVSADLSA
jgi:hypothetical protein